MRSSFVATTGLKLARTPSARVRAARRRLAAILAMAGLAAASALTGYLMGPKDEAQPTVQTGPFSYFPSE